MSLLRRLFADWMSFLIRKARKEGPVITYSWLNTTCENLHETAQSMNRLLPFLLRAKGAPKCVQLAEALKNPLFFVILAHDSEAGDLVVGMASIFYQHNLVYSIAEVHDVVRDPAYRDKQIGRELLRLLIQDAKEHAKLWKQPITISLTSRPSRSSNSLYQELGFQLFAEAHDDKGRNLYRLTLSPK